MSQVLVGDAREVLAALPSKSLPDLPLFPLQEGE